MSQSVGPPSKRVSISIEGTNFVVHPKWLDFVVKYPVTEGPGSPCGAICNLLGKGDKYIKAAMKALKTLREASEPPKVQKRKSGPNTRLGGDWTGRVRKTKHKGG